MDVAAQRANISGYTMGSSEVAKSPLSIEDFEELKKSALFSEEDVFYLRLSLDVLEDQIDDLLKTRRVIIFDHPHLRAYDEDPNIGKVDAEYTKAVGKRFGQWVIDTAKAQYDQAWLDCQYRDRSASPPLEEEQDQCWPHPRPHPRSGSHRFQRCHRRAHETLLGTEGSPAGNRQPHVRCLVEVDDPAGDPVVPTLYPGGRLLAGCPAMDAVAGPSAEARARPTSGANLRACHRWGPSRSPHRITWRRALDGAAFLRRRRTRVSVSPIRVAHRQLRSWLR